jgi:hypothetical protein
MTFHPEIYVSLGLKNNGKRPLWKNKHTWEDNTEMDIRDGVEKGTGFIFLRTGSKDQSM